MITLCVPHFTSILFTFLLLNNHAMKTSMLDYCKVILEKVHFDQVLFHKEYHKSHRWLSGEEREHLQTWLIKKFGAQAMPPSSQSLFFT